MGQTPTIQHIPTVVRDRLAQLLSKTYMFQPSAVQAQRMLDLCEAWPAHWVDIGFKRYDAWERVIEQTKLFQEKETFLWASNNLYLEKAKLAEEKEKEAKHNMLQYKELYLLQYDRLTADIENIQNRLKLSAKDNLILFKSVDSLAYKVENYRNVIKYLHKELSMLRNRLRSTVPYSIHKGTLPNSIGNSIVEYNTDYSSNIRTMYSYTYNVRRQFDELQGANMDNVIDLQKLVKEKQAHKGTDSNIPPPKDWLAEMEEDTYFVCESAHPQDPNPMQHEYILVSKSDKSVKLMTNMNEPEVFVRVNTKKFCALYNLVEILKLPEA